MFLRAFYVTYHSFVESQLTFYFICWFYGLSVKEKNCLSSIIKVSSKVIGVQLTDLSSIWKKRVIQEARRVISHPDHILSQELFLMPSGQRYLAPPEEDKQIRKLIYSFGHEAFKCCWQLYEHRQGIVNLGALMCIFIHYLSLSSCYLLLYWQSGCYICCCCCCFYVTWGCKLNCPVGINKVVWLIDSLKNAQFSKCLSSEKVYTLVKHRLWQTHIYLALLLNLVSLCVKNIGSICPRDVVVYLHIQYCIFAHTVVCSHL